MPQLPRRKIPVRVPRSTYHSGRIAYAGSVSEVGVGIGAAAAWDGGVCGADAAASGAGRRNDPQGALVAFLGAQGFPHGTVPPAPRQRRYRLLPGHRTAALV